MVKIGIIGNVSSLQPYVQFIRKETGFEIVGKSSIGMVDHPAGTLLSVPEFTKNELWEVADAIIVDKPDMVTYDALKEAIKNYKHIYLADIPEISPAQCMDLHKLAQEAGNIVQVRNPLLEDPAANWVAENWQEPVYINFFQGYNDASEKNRLLVRFLLYAHRLFGSDPQKVRVSGVTHPDGQHSFLNIRLDYSTFSALNSEFLFQPVNEIKIRSAMPGKFIETAGHNHIFLNHSKIAIDNPRQTGLSMFIQNIRSLRQSQGTGLHTLYHVLNSSSELNKKITLYSSWNK